MSKYDPLDKAIITCLNRDARMSSSHIARELGVSERTVHNRIKRLIGSKAIQPVAVVNPAVFGYSIAVNVFCESELGHQAQAIEALRDMPEISYIAISTGDHDIILQAFFKDSEAMHEFITHKLHQVPGIQRTRTQLIPHIIKDNFQWIPPEESFVRPVGDQPT